MENALKSVAGISSAKADHNANNVTVGYDETAVTPEQIKDTVDNLGYELIL